MPRTSHSSTIPASDFGDRCFTRPQSPTALNRVIRSISNYVADSAITNPYTAARSAFKHGVENNQNLVTDTAYSARGATKSQTDVLGNVTLYGYDDAGRLIKTIQSASRPTYNNDYAVDSEGKQPDPSLSQYLPSDLPDKDIISLNGYDPAGNLVKTTDSLDHANYTVYDALNRPVKAVRASKPEATLALNFGDNRYVATNDPRWQDYAPSLAPDRDLLDTTEYDALGRVIRTRRLLDNVPTEQWDTTLYGYDEVGRQVKVIRSASQSNYNLPGDPSLSNYVLSTDADLDIVTMTAYDPAGRTMYSEDAMGRRVWTAYDGLGRSIKTVSNPVGTATDNGFKDPRSPYYYPVESHGDRDLIVLTTYDSNGRVMWTQDALGRKTWSAFDNQGRVVRTIANAVGTATDNGPRDPRSPIYIRSTHSDQDLVTETIYDEQGRVSITIDTYGNQTKYFYDKLGRRTKTITNFVDGVANPNITDEDRIQSTTYDLAGRVVSSRDTAGIETHFVYDALGRRTRTIANFVAQGHDPANWVWSAANNRWEDGRGNPINHGTAFDRNLISDTTYNKGGQVISTRDARGTETTFTYDAAGRRLTITQAANTPLATTSYTCYDKAGRTRRSIQNWTNDPTQPTPDARDANGNWLFVPTVHGSNNDRDVITRFDYDRASRRVKVTDPLGNFSLTSYFKDGQVEAITDPEGMVTRYCYDGLRRRSRVIAGFVDNGEDPALWVWNSGWKKKDGTTAIAHGTNSDQNVIVDVTYDKAGRVTQMREPRGNLTTYKHDLRDRRTHLKNPLDQTWMTTYADLNSGTTRTTLTDPNGVNTQRDFDHLGRLVSLTYGDTSTTPDVKFTYDTSGNRSKMTEYSGAGFTTPIRETTYNHDQMHRLTSVGFDNDGSGSADETVSYEYDKGGLRTKLTLPGSLTITYTYDAKGQLVAIKDWDTQVTGLAYDGVGRMAAMTRYNGLSSQYTYDLAGHLLQLLHHERNKVFGRFGFKVDKRGNRTQAVEQLAHPATTTQTIGISDGAVSYYRGTWNTIGSFKVTTDFWSGMTITFTGNEGALTMGTGSDQSIFDIYIDGSLWESFDGYAASDGERIINIYLTRGGSHVIDIRNRTEKNKASSGYKLRFKQLAVLDTVYDLHTIDYMYDALSRLLSASYSGISPSRQYGYAFDLAGNRTQQVVTIGGTPTTTNYTYNAANQLVSDGTNTLTFDNNGNLTDDGPNTYVWDRANRLLSMGGVSNKYDGEGHRIQKTVGVDVTKYLLDSQPGLPLVVAETIGANTTRFVHAPMGIHAREDNTGNWHWTGQDGLGSVRFEASNTLALEGSQHYDGFGNIFGQQGSIGTPFKFTGEIREGDLTYLRARYLNSQLGIFPSVDPFPGIMDRPMSLNDYSWVEGNAVNLTDPSGWFIFNYNVQPDKGFSEGIIEEGDWLYCIGRQGGLTNDKLKEFTEEVVKINGGRDNPAFRWYGNLCADPINHDPCLAPRYTLKIPNYLNPVAVSALQNSCSDLPIVCQTENFWTISDVGQTRNALGAKCGEVIPLPTPTPDPGPPVLTGGFRVFDFTFSAGLSRIPGNPSVGINIQMEWRCAPYKGECGWFANFGIACSATATGARTSKIVAGYSIAAGMQLGVEYWPTAIGSTSYYNTFGASVPYRQQGNLQSDVTWDPQAGSFVWQIGLGSTGKAGASLASGASVYLGSSLGTIPDDVHIPPEGEKAIIEAVEYLIGFCIRA